jgi:hypothetical protein
MALAFLQDEADEIVPENHISVKAAAEFTGYSIRYPRRLLRSGRLEALR